MEIERNEKVLAMYRAVWQLLDEGRDLHKLKVSDITECAGIGKGTAYEYFRSKEEIVSKAMHYNCLLQFHMLRERVAEQENYKTALQICFDWLSETCDSRKLILQVLKQTGDLSKKAGCTCESEKKNGVYAVMMEILVHLVQLGRREKFVRSEISDQMATLQILSQFLGFFVYQTAVTSLKKSEISMTKEFLCDNIMKSLG